MDGAEREEGPEAGEVQPTLLGELANLDPPYEASADDGEGPDGQDEAAAGNDDDEAPAKPGIPTGTKVVVVAAAWLLLTLFLVDRFSDGPTANGSTRLDQAAVGEDEDESPADDEQDGDGDASDDAEDSGGGEAGDDVGAYGEAVAAAGTDPVAGGAGAGGVYPGVPGQVSGGVGGGSATPGAAPAGTSSTAPAGAGGGSTTTAPSTGATTTTTTVAPAGGGSGGGGSTNTTAAPAPAEYTITISGSGRYAYSTANLSVQAGSLVRMKNTSNTHHTWKIGNDEEIPIAKEQTTGYRSFNGTVSFRCTRHDYMTGTITVT